MAQAQDPGIDALGGVRQRLHLDGSLLQRQGGLRSDGSGRGQPHVGHQDVSPGAGHIPRLLLVEHVGRGEQVQLVGHADHVDLRAVAHPSLLQVRPEHPVDQADGREVLDAGEADLLDLAQEIAHHTEWVCAVDPCQHRRVPNYRQHLIRHLHDDRVGVAIGQQSRQGAAPSHPEPA